jgi:membrane-bound serine protease (ClpP class)
LIFALFIFEIQSIVTAMVLVVTLIVVGAILLFLETVLPGMVAGTVGVVCLAAGVVVAYMRFDARVGNGILLLVVVGLIAGAALYLRYFPSSRAARLFVSEQTVGDLGVERGQLLNQTGTALTQLRPSGVATIGGRRVDVVAEGALIEKGAAVRVIAVEGSRVVVRAMESGTAENKG